MKVQLIDYTGAGAANPARHAANVLAFTKSTRLAMRPQLLEEISRWSGEAMEEALKYMANTIPSSWEFVDYTFLISDVTRAFTHQLVRNRTGSYAQQTMRVLDVGGWTYETGPTIGEQDWRYDDCMRTITETYSALIENGAAIEDARGVLPTNIHTNIVAKFNLRSLCALCRSRASGRTQLEYRSVVEGMKAEVRRVHPWAEFFLARTFDTAAAELEAAVRGAGLPAEDVTRMTKLIDQLRATA